MGTVSGARNIQIGLKLWSTNVELARKAADLYKEKWIGYIELYAVPGTYETTIDVWTALGAPFMVHCPHSAHGFNLAKAELWEKNQEEFREVQRFSDALKARAIVVHGGNNGRAQEVIRQLKALKDERIFLENKPRLGLNREICIAHSPQELAVIKSGAGLKGFVLDFGHAICTAHSLKQDAFSYIDEFMKLGPKIFHMGDGDRFCEQDRHDHFGKGNFDLSRLAALIPRDSCVTIETPMDPKHGLKDCFENILYLQNLLNGSGIIR